MMRRLYHTLMGASLAALVATATLKAGPEIEGWLAPVRVNQTTTVVERTSTHVCWMWIAYKNRNKVSDNIDVYVDTKSYAGAAAAPWRMSDHFPWQPSAALPAHQWSRQAWCVDLPPYVKAQDSVTVRQTIHYPGIFGLWDVRLPVPTVTFAPEQPS